MRKLTPPVTTATPAVLGGSMNSNFKSLFTATLLFLAFSATSLTAKADAFYFAVSGVAPSSYYTKSVVVDVVEFTGFCPWGWQNFYLNIDGYNYPIGQWNSVPTSPNSLRAWFNVPNTYWGAHRLQLIVEAWAQPFYGIPVPTGTFFSYPQIYQF